MGCYERACGLGRILYLLVVVVVVVVVVVFISLGDEEEEDDKCCFEQWQKRTLYSLSLSLSS